MSPRNNGNTDRRKRPQASKTARYSGVDSQSGVYVDPFGFDYDALLFSDPSDSDSSLYDTKEVPQ